eukprot:999816-Prymnesium_polylepis.1
MLRRTGMPRVDILSLDVEGFEDLVLAGLDLNSIEVDMILLEPSCKRERTTPGRGPCALLRQANYSMLSGAGMVDHAWLRPGGLAARIFGSQAHTPFRCRPDPVACRGWDYEGHGRDYDDAVEWER